MSLSSRNHARETHDSSCHLQWHQLEWNIEERRRRLPKTALLLLAYCLLKLFYCFEWTLQIKHYCIIGAWGWVKASKQQEKDMGSTHKSSPAQYHQRETHTQCSEILRKSSFFCMRSAILHKSWRFVAV